MARLELRAARKRYGSVDAIHGIDLDVASGEFCVFVGPSGCGKSTLLRMIAGLEDITRGEIALDGEVVNDIPAARRGLAMVFQSYALYPHMSVRANLSFGLENINMPRDEIRKRVEDAARMLQIDEYLDRRPGQLSGGQRQRVAIGRAVVREPRVFLFDEPLSNLDAELRVATRREIAALHKRLGNTMVYVTHDQVEAMTMADKIAVLRAGRLEQFGAPLELYNRPCNVFVAGFIGSPKMNFMNGTIIDSAIPGQLAFRSDGGVEVSVEPSQFDVSAGSTVTLGIRPNHMSVSSDGAGIPVQVQTVEHLGGETFVYGESPDNEGMTVQLRGQTDVRIRDRLTFCAEIGKQHIFDYRSGQSLRRESRDVCS